MASLDLLCDLLDAEVSDEDDENKNGEEKETAGGTVVKEGGDACQDDDDDDERLVIDAMDEPFNNEEEEKAADGGDHQEEEEDEMEKQLKAMQKQMADMQRKLEEKKAKKGEKSKKAGGAAVEVDIFSKEGSSSNRAGPRSPVRTNPFAEADERPRRVAKVHAKTPMFGPALSEKTSRVLGGKEKEEHLAQFPPTHKRPQTSKSLGLAMSDDGSSGDEEDARNPMEQRYNAYGKDIRRIAKKQAEQPPSKVGFNQVRGSSLNLTDASSNRRLPSDLLVEPNSKLRVARPLLTKTELLAHLLGKRFVNMYRIKEAVSRKEHDGGDWTTMGVMYYKASQTSKNGNAYTMWKMTDLQGGDIRSVTVFLFGNANARHYKMPLNKVVGLLNAKVMDDRSGKGEVNLSVDHPDKILEIGDSIDAGKCKAQKQDGSGCTNLVNLSSCEYCAYHVKRAYRSMSSKRGEIQSTFSGSEGVRARIMNKVDPKGSYFTGSTGYMNKVAHGGIGGGNGGGVGAGGVGSGGSVGRLSADRRRRDAETLANLNGTTVEKVLRAEERQKSSTSTVVVDGKLKFRSHLSDAEKNTVKRVAVGVSAEMGMNLLSNTPGARNLIRTLTKKDTTVASAASKQEAGSASTGGDKSATQLLFEHKRRMAEERARKVLAERQATTAPKLGRGFGKGDTITLSSPSDRSSLAKTRALMALGGKALSKSSGNYVSSRQKRKAEGEDDADKRKERISKRLKECDEEKSGDASSSDPKAKSAAKVTTLGGEVMTAERMEAIKNMKSQRQDLIDSYENEQEEKMFDHLERKEAMEEKMINTKELETKAVTCAACNYTAFTQSDLCKSAGHSARVIRVKKRFFECKKCKNRTISLDRYPKSACSNCGESNKWHRVGMARERKGPTLESERLSIRGVEEKFLGQSLAGQNLNINI